MQKLRSNPNKLLKAAAALVLLAIAVSLTAYPLPTQAQALSTDATLSALTVSPRDIIGFSSVRFAYDVGVASTVTEATITATATNSNADVSFDTPDSNDMTDGHQVALSAGRNEVTITVTAQDGSDEQDYTVSVNQGVSGDYGWNAERDLDGLITAENQGPSGIWGNGATFWVSDVEDDKLYAYNADGTRDASQDFNTLAATQNTNPAGIWSNGVTMWVADNSSGRLFAYRMSDKQRDSAKDFTNLATGNGAPSDLWSDGTTMWVSDLNTDQIFAYRMSDQQPDATRGFTSLDADSESPGGIWSDGLTMWVGDYGDDKLYAYDMTSRARLESRDFNALETARNGQPEGIWSDGTTMWVADYNDHKVYAYNMPPSNDNRLSSLTVSPKNIIGFDPDRFAYDVGVASTVTEATVAATATDSNATVDYSGTDSNNVTPGHQVALSAGRNPVTITVTAEDSSTQDYTVSVNQGVTTPSGWKASDDLDGLIAAGNERSRGMCANDTTFWIADSGDSKIYAYNPDGTRNTAQDFNTLDAENTFPGGIWCDDTYMWVLDVGGKKIYAYLISSKERQSDQDFNTLEPTENDDPSVIWSDGSTMWVADSIDDKLYAYKMSDKTPDTGKEFNTLFGIVRTPTGLWSDGATMWVSDITDNKLYAYRMSDTQRDEDKDLNTPDAAGNTNPTGIWGKDRTIWVADITADKVYSYNKPLSDDATLSGLTVGPKDIIGFDAERTSYQVGVASTVTQATVIATPNHPAATVDYSGTDADLVTDGHQVDLSDGRNTVTITVTAEDGSNTQDYTVSVNRGVTDDYGWKASDDLDGLIAAGNIRPTGIHANDTTAWVLNTNNPKKIFAYSRSTGARDTTKDFDIDLPNPVGMWSDGPTLWVTEYRSDTGALRAYTLATGTRLPGQDFENLTAAGNISPFGIWSDGTTMWVADSDDRHLYAYDRVNKTRQMDKELTLSAFDWNNNEINPGGFWMDDTTIWVASPIDDDDYITLVRAIKRSDGSRNTLKDIPLGTAGSDRAWGIWADDETMLIVDGADDKVYSFNLPVPSDDAMLSALTVSPRDIIGFDAERTSYEVGVASTVAEATVAATANDSNADVSFDPQDSNDVTDGHQVALSAGRNTVTITVTAENGSDEQDYTVSVNQGVSGDYGWNAERDLDGLEATLAGLPFGIWSNSTTIWVVDSDDESAFAYNHDGTRDAAKDFDFDSSHQAARGAWSDGEYVWITDRDDNKLYVYEVATGTRQNSREFDLDTENVGATGVWSDGATIWVADSFANKVFAYALDGGARQDGDDIDLASDNNVGGGIWSDGATIWVSEERDTNPKLFAYVLDGGDRVEGRDFNTLQAAGASLPTGLWSDGETMWVADVTENNSKIYAYNMPPSADNRLSDLTVSPKNIFGFDAGRTSYQVGVASTVTQATITATANHANATVDYSGTDVDAVADGHQMDLSEGRNPVTITVTAEDNTTQDYTVSVNRGVTTGFGWNAEHDLDGIIAGGTNPSHLWTNGTTIWVSDITSTVQELHAYNTGGTRDSAKDFNTLEDANNTTPTGIWSNGTTMWVADSADADIYAYSVSTKAQDTTKKFDDLNANNSQPRGIWSNDTTLWVADSADDKIFAYNLSSKEEETYNEFDNLDPENGDPRGIWSDGETMWVSDVRDRKIYAYNMGTKSRDQTKEFDTPIAAGQANPFGITSNGTIMWVSDSIQRKLYAYNLPPPSDDATLSDLTVSPKDIIGFDADRTAYEVGVASTVSQATVTGTPNDPNAGVSYSGTDADDMTDGHQVALSAGRNEVTITVTAENDRTQDYTVSINQGVTDDYGWNAEKDLDGLIAAGQQQAAGIWSNGTTIWVTDPGNKRLTAYNRDGTRNSSEDFNALAEGQNAQPAGIWSNGTTMWVADGHLGNLFAYNMSDKQRDTTKDIRTFILYPGGVWSDGTTIWVLNAQNATILAFNISSRSLDSAKEFNTLVAASNQTPRGIWSDRTTMWVADAFGDKVYAYNMSDKQRDDTKDFNTLSSAGNHDAYGLWSDHTTMWITDQVDRKVYSYNKPLSADNTLSTLTVSPKDITGFDPERTSYEVGLASTVPQATVVARATNGAATVNYSGTDADLVAPGHQVNLSDGRNTITVTVTAQDNTEKAYTVSINRGVTDDYGWNAERDLDGIETAGNETPIGIWSNSTTIWVVDSDDESAFAYNHDGTRDADKDFDFDSNHQAARGAWSDGEYVWIVDRDDNKLYVYEVATGTRQNSREFDLDTENATATGVWSDGATIWVTDSFVNKVFAYALDGGTRQDGDDIALASANSIGGGIWSDGATIWVSQELETNPKLFAYVLDGGVRVEDRDFNTLQAAGASLPTGLWSDGETMWVADVTENNSKIYAFNMPPSANANLSSLTVSPKDIIGFAPDRTSYEVGVASTVAEATVAATATDSNADVSFDPQDSNDMTDGHQVALVAGRNTVDVTVTAEDGSTQDYTVNVNQGVKAQYGWKAGDDLDGLIAAGNRGPRGIWGNSSTFYISDFDDDKVYAYNRDGTRDDTKDFDTTGSTFPNGIWSDGTTLWVADSASTTLFAYTLSNGNRNTGAEITLANPARGVWGNSTTIWAVNETTDKLEAYQKSDGTDDNDKDITLDSANADPAGIWSDDTTIWVADHADHKLYAYTLSNGDRDSSKDIDTSTSGNENPRGLWGEGDTIWVTDEDDDRVYSYNLVDNRSSDATLSDLITSPRNILRFDADRTAYEVGVASTVAQATVTATANDAKASVDYSGTDADDMTPGHQVDLSAGRNQVTVTVTAENDSTKTYRVRINRGVDTPYGWKAEHDLDGLVLGVVAGLTDRPAGIAESGGIFWISPVFSRNVLAYEQDGSRLPARDISLHSNNTRPWYLWTDGQTLWISDVDDDKLYAYRLSDGARQTDREFDLHTDNASGTGIWSDGITMWVPDRTNDRLYAYSLEDGTRQESKEFDLHSDNDDPRGIWSDGYIIWVADDSDSKIYAYGLESGEREANQDFNTPSAAQNRHVADIWSDGATMWVVDEDGRKVYAYNMPPSNDARLSDLTVSPKNIIRFDAGRTSYEVGVASAVAQATVTGTPANPNARVDFSGTDADLNTTGHQVNLSAGRNEVTVTVTAQDGNNTQEYAVSINRGVAADFGWKASDDLDGFIAHELFVPTGIASDGSRFWVTTENDLDIFAFNYLGLPDATRNITPDSDNGNPTYMWADATTLFVVDPVDLLVYAYRLSDGAVQTSREFALLSANSDPTGIWSDGVTAWVADSADHQLYSYNLALRQPDDDKNIDLDGDNTDPAGVASNGATIWVADATDQKAYAYALQGGGRVVTKEINTLVNAGNSAPSGMWATLDTIWINDAGDSKTYTYNLPPARTPQQVAADATLSALTISPKNIVRFDPEDTSYEVGVASTVTEATVAATPNAPNAMAFITPTDANAVTEGHQVNLSAGRNPVTIRVTAENGAIRTYRVSINRGVTANFGWKADDDLDGLPQLAGQELHRGIAENNGVFWISSSRSRTLDAYQQDGSRLPARDIDLHSTNNYPSYLWTNGTTIWVGDPAALKLFAYRLSDGNRQETKDITLHADNRRPTGIWSNGTTIWVFDITQARLYAYALDGGARQESREFDLHSSNEDPRGIWSDGYTMWVADTSDDKLYAYFLETGQRRPRLEFNTLRGIGNQVAVGITSKGTTMWVVDAGDRKVYSYNLLLSDDSTLSALTVSPKDIIGFDAERDSYQLGVDSTVARATVTATANHPGARVTFTPPDASSGTRGHQVDLSAGRNPVTVTVTAEDGTTQDYTLSINRGVADDFGWNAGNDLDGLELATSGDSSDPPEGITRHNGIIWVSSTFSPTILAYRQDGSRLPTRDFTASANRDHPYLFTDGQTIWIVDLSDKMVHAYQLSDGSRQESMDIALHADNGNPAGVWSDGTTMWVADNIDHKLYAYSLDGGVRQESREYGLDSGNNESRGIWSNGNTVWVVDNTDRKLYAYALEDGERQTGRDFNTLNAAGNETPLDITSGSNIMWVTDLIDNKVYSYNMPLSPPANLETDIGDRRIAITWDNPQRSAITGYQYRVSSDDAVSWNPDWTTMPGSNARTTTFTVRNLANTFEHVIEVRALEGAKSSGAASFAATPMGPPSMPLMPENLDTVAGDQTIYLSWHKPVEDPRAPVTSFDARYRPYGSSRSWRNAASVSVEQTPRILYNQTIEGLDNRQPYEVQAAAVNSVGRSEWATASAVPQADFRYGPPSDDGNEALDLGPLHASWTDRLNSDTFHPDQKRLNINVIENSCMAPATFRIFWDSQNKAAKEYEADIQTREGAGEFTYQFGTETFMDNNTRYEQGYIYGTASLHKSSTLSVRVRARFNPEGWSTWSETADLFCFETETPATSLQLAEADNSPATGQPTISGRAEVGETLTASTGAIADPDGLASTAFSYQWSRDDGSAITDISGATTSTYTLQEEDLDYQVSVTVAFTDDEGNDETITSAPVLVLAATLLSGAFDSATLPGQHDGSSTFSFEIHFSEEPVLGFEDVRDHVLDVTNGDVVSVRRTTPGSNLRWEITVQPNGNDEVTLLLPLTDNCGDEGAVCTGSEKKLLIGAVVFVRGPATSQEQTAANSPATGNPAVTGTARVGQTLSADTPGIADADGLQNATFSFQWVSSDGATDSDIPGETGATYVVQPGDAGRTIKVRVSFTDDAGNEETLSSAATAAVAATFPGAPRSLEVQTGGTGELAVTWQEPESNGGSDVTGYRVQWKLATGSWDTEADVSSATATGTSYTITSLALDNEYAVRVIAANGAGDGPPSAERTETARARTSEQQDSTPNTAATGAPTISGKAQAGEALTADTSDIADENGLDNASFSYQWVSYDGNADTDIPGAAGSTYTLVPADEGRAFRVRVSFTDDDGHRESLTSALARSERPYALSASASDGTVALTWKLPVGWPYSSTFQILRNRPELGEAEPLVLVKYLQAPGNAHTDTDVAAGVLYVYRVKGVDPFGYPLEASQPVEIRAEAAAPADNNPASGAPTISGTAQAGETLTADTSGIADEDGLDNAAFSYQWLADDTAISGATGSTYTLAAADEGKTVKVRVSFTDDGGNDESLTSDATATVSAAPAANTPATGAPTISGTVRVGETLAASTSGISDADGLTGVSYTYQWVRNDGNSDSDIQGTTGSTYTLGTADEGKTIKVRATFTDDANNEETLTSRATEAVAAPPPLTVSVTTAAPATHDGSAEFTFEIQFSEEPHADFSYRTLRDHAFTVTGGAVKKAQRLQTDPESNIPWRITVQPDGNGDVTVALPVTTDCGDQGAICTGDGRKLSNGLEFTVSGLGE